jgi:uncharacterized membrane protein
MQTMTAAPPRIRVASIDVLRGIVMILMALDHVRDFFGTAASPTNVATATVPLFFTRWITHLCAPTFFLLTGTGAHLAGRRRSAAELSRFLLTRGLWLIGLELTVLRCLGYQFNFDYHVTLLLILWASGWSMITLAALVRLPLAAITTFGIVLIAGHNLLDGINPATLGWFAPIFTILHVQNVVFSKPGYVVFAIYPLVPWIGVTAAGYGLGRVFEWDDERRRRMLLRLGLALSAAFVVVRAINVYGDPVRWAAQASTVRTALSFLNATKYPPSLVYLLMTLGPAMLILRALDRQAPAWLRPAHVLGRVPLFYFVLHLPLIHLLALVVCYARYGEVHWIFESPTLAQFPFARPPGWGYSLPVVYVIWVGVVIALYPVCRWFADVRRRRTDPWLSYL